MEEEKEEEKKEEEEERAPVFSPRMLGTNTKAQNFENHHPRAKK